jgi:hypothetical protein
MNVRDLIYDAMAACGVNGRGETPADSDAQLCLRRLRRMIDSWANDNLTVYNTTAGTMTLTANTASYSTTLLSSGRPVTIQNAYLTRQGIAYPLRMVSEQEYNGIADKSAQGLPSVVFYDPSYPNGTFYFYPVPDAADVVTVNGRFPLMTSSIFLATALSLPPGYEAALCDNLAVDISPSFGVTPSATLVKEAKLSRSALKTTNQVPPTLRTALPGAGYGTPGYIRILGDT